MIFVFLSYLVALHVLAGTPKIPTLTQGAQDFHKKGEMTMFEAIRNKTKQNRNTRL